MAIEPGTPLEEDMRVPQGGTFDVPLEYLDENYNIVDVSDWDAELQVWDNALENLLFTAKTNPDDLSTQGQIILNPGEVRFYFSKEATSKDNMNFSTGIYQVELYPPKGTVVPFLEGRFIVSRRIIQNPSYP